MKREMKREKKGEKLKASLRGLMILGVFGVLLAAGLEAPDASAQGVTPAAGHRAGCWRSGRIAHDDRCTASDPCRIVHVRGVRTVYDSVGCPGAGTRAARHHERTIAGARGIGAGNGSAARMNQCLARHDYYQMEQLSRRNPGKESVAREMAAVRAMCSQ